MTTAHWKPQHHDVANLMLDGEWRSLEDISLATGHPQASVSARLRDFRKADFGSHFVRKRLRYYGSRKVYEYLLIARPDPSLAIR